MPSVSVPLYGNKRWFALMTTRKNWWAKEDRNQLTEHFKATEFYCHDGSPCPIVARPAMVKVCEVYLEPLRDEFGPCHVLSGYRHERYNHQIGGARHSQHIYEQTFEAIAADIRFGKGSPEEWARKARVIRQRELANKGGVGVYPRMGFIHVDNRAYVADWSG